ncbi:MAG: hypothetical protein IPL54_16985 [Chitinophagaceae bacterium]|nr:hypothetical protein [Chitinophagaceae bacterium]
MVKQLNHPFITETEVIAWSCPVPLFGNIVNAKIATLGLNPSNREFVDQDGIELSGSERRFQTLSSLGLNCWSNVKPKHINLILEDCEDYFNRNPYDAWFKKLDHIISGTSMSYYFPSGQACHLDLIPFATSRKWSELSSIQQDLLLTSSSEYFASILNSSKIELLILNGRTVVNSLQKMSDVIFTEIHMPDWTLPRKESEGVSGYAYIGVINSIAGMPLKKSITILGYNHNIQSSFGVTKNVQKSIRDWVTEKTKEIFHEKK